jgi:ectoine hydroxylase-related dioxygenase (phytanoyl-CoA dioxygenase family)
MDPSTPADYARDGAVLIESFLDAAQLQRCRAAYDWSIANPGPDAQTLYRGTDKEHHVDNANPRATERLKDLVRSIPFGDLFAELWGSRRVWFFAEEVFLKEGARGGRTPWHQDTSYMPWSGAHWANAWIAFEPVPRANALEIIRGSHLGARYDGSDFQDPHDPTAPLHGGGALPRLPDIEAERTRDPRAYDVLSWASRPGDVVVLHPGALHGGAPVDADLPVRHTLVLRFFGDHARFSALPGRSQAGYTEAGTLFLDEIKHLREGDLFRAPCFEQLR